MFMATADWWIPCIDLAATAIHAKGITCCQPNPVCPVRLGLLDLGLVGRWRRYTSRAILMGGSVLLPPPSRWLGTLI